MLKGKIAVVTGGGRGIGKNIAKVFANQGATVVINYRKSQAEAEAVVEEIRAAGGTCEAFKCDISVSSEVDAFFKTVVERFVRMDILVNNAGVTKDGLIMRMKDDDFNQVVDINLKGTFFCTRAASNIMMKQRYGRIVNISSVIGLIGNAGQANYAASKAGIIGLSQSVAKELATRNVTVNVVAPGFIESDMTEVLSDKVKEAILGSIPMKRMGTGEEVANAALFLASDLANYITGQVITVDGGMVM